MAILFQDDGTEVGSGTYAPIGGAVPFGVPALAAGKGAKPEAVAKGGVKASGTITFGVQPTTGDSIKINGTTVTFVTSGATGNQVNLGANLAATLTALATFLNGSADTNLVKATYTVNTTTLTVKAVSAVASVGNAITISSTQVNGVA